MQRQAMEISINDLRRKADELFRETLEIDVLKGMSFKDILKKKWQVCIINRHNTSDEWKFE